MQVRKCKYKNVSSRSIGLERKVLAKSCFEMAVKVKNPSDSKIVEHKMFPDPGNKLLFSQIGVLNSSWFWFYWFR